jgi:hypothetical protein
MLFATLKIVKSMASSKQPGEAFIYAIPAPALSRGIALAMAGFSISAFLFFLTLTFRVAIASLEDALSLWLILTLTLVAGAFFLVLAFPPRSWGAWIEFGREGIRYLPKPPMRGTREPSISLPIDTCDKEILICEASEDVFDKNYGLGSQKYPFGFRVLIRDSKSQDRVLKVETADRMTGHQTDILTEGISASTGLPVRLVQRESSAEGMVRELPWIPDRRTLDLSRLFKLAFGTTPFIGGMVVGYLRPELVIVAAVGIALWLAQTAVLFTYAHLSRRKLSGAAKLYWATTIYTFAISYLLAYAIVFYVFRSR